VVGVNAFFCFLAAYISIYYKLLTLKLKF